MGRSTPCSASRRNRAARSAWLDVLVRAEEVRRVMDALESREPLVSPFPIGRTDSVSTFVAEKVDVDAPARVRLQRGVEVACPGHVPVALGVVLHPDRI